MKIKDITDAIADGKTEFLLTADDLLEIVDHSAAFEMEDGWKLRCEVQRPFWQISVAIGDAKSEEANK